MSIKEGIRGCNLRVLTQIVGIFQIALAIVISVYLWTVFFTQEWQLGLLKPKKPAPVLTITQLDCMCIAIVLTIQILAVPMSLCLFYGAQNENPTYLKYWIYFAIHSSIVTSIAAIIQWVGSAAVYVHLIVLVVILLLQELCVQIVRFHTKEMEDADEENAQLERNIAMKHQYFRNILAYKKAHSGGLHV